MEEKLISVIIPVYKVEKYLDYCLESVVKQTYKNLEIILVDDGSPDACPQNCDNWAKKDNRIKVIHKQNGGVSSARNAGLDVASGDYILFIDSDDMMERNSIEILYNVLIETNADIAHCNWKQVYDLKNYRFINYKLGNIELINDNDVFELLFNKKISVIASPWSKLYKKELFDGIRYPKNQIHEDEYVIPQILSKVKKLAYINLPLYLNLYRNDSITGAKFSQKRLDAIKAKEFWCEFCEKTKPEYAKQAYQSLTNICILYYYYAKLAHLDKQIVQGLKQRAKDNIKRYKLNSKLFLMFNFAPHILEILVRLKK